MVQDVTPPVDAEGYATIMRAAATEGDVIRCRCGMQVEDGGMVQCDACGAWQHTVCMDTATHRQRKRQRSKWRLEWSRLKQKH